MDVGHSPPRANISKRSSNTSTLSTYQRLRFLNDDASSVNQQNSQRRKTVRSHVMLDVHRRSRQAAMRRLKERPILPESGSGSPESPSVDPEISAAKAPMKRYARLRPTSPESDTGTGRNEASPPKPFPITLPPEPNAFEPMDDLLSPMNLLDQGISDPFDSFSISISRSQVRNLHHFFHNILPRRQNFQLATWAAYNALLADPAVLIFVLAKAFLHLAMLARIRLRSENYDNGVEFLHYKIHGTRLIGQKLTTTDAAISDANFLAIVDLITCFTCSGDVDEASTHLKGLQQMLKLRGGMQRLSPFLAYRVILADTTVAAMTGSSPLIEVPSCIESVRDRKIIASIGAFSSTNITTSFAMLRYAFTVEDFTLRLSANILLLERDLLVESRIYRDNLLNVGSSTRPTVHTAEAMRLAHIIYIELHTVPSWRHSHIIRNLVTRLIDVLQRTPLNLLWMPYNNALLLVLLLGGVGASGHAAKSWFVAQLRSLRNVMELQNFGQVKEMIGVVHLMEGGMEVLMGDIWRDVERPYVQP